MNTGASVRTVDDLLSLHVRLDVVTVAAAGVDQATARRFVDAGARS